MLIVNAIAHTCQFNLRAGGTGGVIACTDETEGDPTFNPNLTNIFVETVGSLCLGHNAVAPQPFLE